MSAQQPSPSGAAPVPARIAAGDRGLGATAAGGLAAATSAALVERVAAASGEAWHDAPGAAAQAHALRARLEELSAQGADAYADAVEVLHARSDAPGEAQDHRLGAALRRAAEIPAVMAEACADVADLAAHAAHDAPAEVRADAAASAMLADAAARVMDHVVRINLTTLPDDPLCATASAAAQRAHRAAERAQRASD